MFSCSFLTLISKPTRVSDNSATLIDNIFTNNPTEFISGNIISCISDHYPNFVIRKNVFSRNLNISAKVIKYRLINDSTLKDLEEALYLHDFSDVYECNDVSLAHNIFSNTIDHYYNLHCPIRNKTISSKSLKNPWITKTILSNIKKRQNYHILFKQNKISANEYHEFRNFVTNQIRNSKRDYFSMKFNQFHGDSKNTLKVINNILKPNRRNNNKKSIKKIIMNNVEYSDNQVISDKFNEFFISIGKNIAESLPNQGDHLHYLEGDYPNSFYFSPINHLDIKIIISSLKNKTFGPNTYPVKVLKYISNPISHILSHLINISLESGEFPNSLKTARVTPIFKDGNPNDLSNYRPISVLPLLSKVYEKAVYRQIYEFLERKNILFKNQFGFRCKKSTTNAIINQLQYLYNNLDSNHYVFSLFLDFRKAFDSVDHKILLSKLSYYGFRGKSSQWINSYLTNRKQYTSIENLNSSLLKITHGVPQGSILGPLLFLIFINDLPNSSTFFKYILFADDSTLSTSFQPNDLPKMTRIINKELTSLNKWLNANKISINVSKTKYLLFSYRNQIKLRTIKIGKAKISEKDHIKFLGILIDNRLKFHFHTSYISSKLSKQIGLLYKLSKYIPTNVLKLLYNTLFLPYINYGIEAWFGSFSNNTEKIFILQKKSIRAINCLPFCAHTNQYFSDMNLLKLNDLYCYKISILMFKIINSIENSDLDNFLIKFSDIHSYPTRNHNNYILPKYNKNRSKFCIDYQAIKTWNSLPDYLKATKSPLKFKKLLYNHLISMYNND